MARFPRLSLFGLPLRTTWTWIVVALSMTVISFSQFVPASGNVPAWVLWALTIAAGTVGSILAHDYGHVVAARSQGVDLSSLEPSIIGALPDTCYAARSPAQEVRVALAGPMVSLAIGAVLGALWLLFGSPREMPGSLLWILAAVNGGIATIGFLPGYPFDGGRIFRAFLWYVTDDIVRATRIASIYGHVLLFLGLLGGVVLLSMGETHAVWGTWILILCWTVNRARSEGYLEILWTEAGKSLQIDDLFQAGVNRVPMSATIDDCIESLLDNFRRGPTLVVDHGDVVGIVELESVRRIPRAEWTQKQVGDVMTPVADLPRMESTTPVTQLLAALPSGTTNVVLIENNGRIVAAADREFVMDRVESYIRAQHFNRRRRR